MDINLTMKDLQDLRNHLKTKIHIAKRYKENHKEEEHDKRRDGKKTYYDIVEDKIIVLEPILNKIEDQFKNQNIRLKITTERRNQVD